MTTNPLCISISDICDYHLHLWSMLPCAPTHCSGFIHLDITHAISGGLPLVGTHTPPLFGQTGEQAVVDTFRWAALPCNHLHMHPIPGSGILFISTCRLPTPTTTTRRNNTSFLLPCDATVLFGRNMACCFCCGLLLGLSWVPHYLPGRAWTGVAGTQFTGTCAGCIPAHFLPL